MRLSGWGCRAWCSSSFNPWRVFWLVATSRLPTPETPIAMFQSMAGFLARCDGSGGQSLLGRRRVSIPGGFSGSLRRYNAVLGYFQSTQFQSLAGFLARCDYLCPGRPPVKCCCFNPWRVFWLVATSRTGALRTPGAGFNPWRVFWLVAT